MSHPRSRLGAASLGVTLALFTAYGTNAKADVTTCIEMPFGGSLIPAESYYVVRLVLDLSSRMWFAVFDDPPLQTDATG